MYLDLSCSFEMTDHPCHDAAMTYRYENWEFFVVIENLLDSDNRESQFFYESRLRDEREPVEDIHFTPGNPFNFRIGVTYYLRGILDKIGI